MPLNPLLAKDLKKIVKNSKNNFQGKSEYICLKNQKLPDFPNFDIKIAERLAKIVRGLIFATVEHASSGHPGGSSSKVEQFLAMTLGGSCAFDPMDPKHPGRDRIIWSAGHCTPLLYAGQALYYEALRRVGRQFSEAGLNCVLPEHLGNFRRFNGLPGHAESPYPFCDYSTGPSGHGFSAAGGIAMSHRASGLPTKVWVFMGDAESEEGITYEARNILSANAVDNIIVSLDYNNFGIDGPVGDVMPEEYSNYWLGFGWNVIEVDGHNINQLCYAYELARQGFKNKRPTCVLARTTKGKGYGKLENKASAHSKSSHIDKKQYVDLMKKLGFKVDGSSMGADCQNIINKLADNDCAFIQNRLNESAKRIEPESALVDLINRKLSGRPIVNPRTIKRPSQLPSELVFKSGENVHTRHASEIWFEWLMKQTAFFYAGAGDLSKSVLTAKAEEVYGIISAKHNLGRGIRFGIAEQNMAMMSMAMTQDILPGGIKPVSVFGTYGVFTAMYGHAVHLALVNNAINHKTAGFFIALATHDGPETGEDGPTHQGLYWQSLFKAYPGMKVFKPLDANETIEMLFYALEKGEPIILALPRIATPVLSRDNGLSDNKSCLQGAYIYKNFENNGRKKIVLAVSGAVTLQSTLQAMVEVLKKYDVKIVAVTSPELFVELQSNNPEKAGKIISDEERATAFCLHNGWKGFLDELLLPINAVKRRQGIDNYLKSGSAPDILEMAGLDSKGIVDFIDSNI
jgi:transketolase